MTTNPIQNNKTTDVQSTDFLQAIANYNDALLTEDVSVATASIGRTFESHETNMSVRSDYHRGDYEYFRSSETVPTQHKHIMTVCDEAYENIAIVKNIIDLMAEFGVSGIRLQHPDKSVEKFYNTWFHKVNGVDVSERFLNILYRLGNVIVNRLTGSISGPQHKQWRQSKAKKRVIPLEYYFSFPGNVVVTNEKDAIITGKYKFGLVFAGSVYRDSAYFQKVSKKHDRISKPSKNNNGNYIIPLSSKDVSVFYYKKDDWNLWAKPMIYSIIKDLIMYEKLKLADVSALDGVISNVRLWRFGIYNESNPAHSILPTKNGIAKLRSILHNNVGGGVLDLIWGPELDFKESSTDAYKWLGQEKYMPTLNAIYDGLGIPAVLRTGSAKTSSGEVIGLQTLIERLEYGRSILMQFWRAEITDIHKAMGYTSVLPKIAFDQMILADRAAERKLLMDLVDRDIISNESVVEVFGKNSDIETARIKQQNTKEDNMPYKASPFHNPDKTHEYKKMFIQGGDVTPSEIGLELSEKKKEETSRLDKQMKVVNSGGNLPAKPKQGSPGRPANITETKKRKPKPDVKNAAALLMWAQEAQQKISNIATPALLYAFGKKSVRGLTKTEYNAYEQVKLNILFNSFAYTVINDTYIYTCLQNNVQLDNDIKLSIEELWADFVHRNNREPKVDEAHQIYASIYTMIHKENTNGSN